MASFTALVPITIEADDEEQAAAIFEKFCAGGYDGLPPVEEMQQELEMESMPAVSIGECDWEES